MTCQDLQPIGVLETRVALNYTKKYCLDRIGYRYLVIIQKVLTALSERTV